MLSFIVGDLTELSHRLHRTSPTDRNLHSTCLILVSIYIPLLLGNMQSTNLESNDEVTMMKLLSKIQMHEAQKTLLSETINNRTLLESKIISSLQPSVGRTFMNESLENRKKILLLNTRMKFAICN